MVAPPSSRRRTPRAAGPFTRASWELRDRGVDPEHALLAVAALVTWRFFGLLRRVKKLERDAAAVDKRLEALDKVLGRAEATEQKVVAAEKEVEKAAWDLGGAIKLW